MHVGDGGLAAVDKRNLEATGMSGGLNPTTAADYRLRRISTLHHLSLQRDELLPFTVMLLDNSNSVLHITALYFLYKGALLNGGFCWVLA